jgi:hypothetical protein
MGRERKKTEARLGPRDHAPLLLFTSIYPAPSLSCHTNLVGLSGLIEKAMPAQLLHRLNRFLDDQTVRNQIMNLERTRRADVLSPPPPPAPQNVNTRPHWPAGNFGSAMGQIHCIVIHETSGVPSYSAINTFVDRYTCMGNEAPPRSKDRGIGPQYFVEPNGTVYTLIGNARFSGNPRHTSHAGWRAERINMNPFALGVESADIGDSSISPGTGNGPFWWALSNDSTDLTGMKLYLTLYPTGQEDAQLIWIAQFPRKWVHVTTPPPPHWVQQATNVSPGYEGAGDIIDGVNPENTRNIRGPKKWRNMLFTERNFRTLVLLCRLLAEQNGLPRNFPVLPYASADPDSTNSGVFRTLILAEQRRDEIAVQLGSTTAVIQANTAQFTQFYQASPTTTWSRLFGVIPGRAASPGRPAVASRPITPCFRGILAHSANGGHPCPGPLFVGLRLSL